MRRSNLVLIVLGVIGGISGWAAGQTLVAGPFTYSGNGDRYYLLNTPTWEVAEAWAVARGGHLATVKWSAENEFIRANVATYGGVNRKVYIGLNDAAVEGSLVWSSGIVNGFINWNAGQPANSASNDYVLIRPDAGGLWDLVQNSFTPFAVVQIGGPVRVPLEVATIQAGIDAAPEGGLVLVSPGTYPGQVNFGARRVAVRSTDGAAATIIDGQGLIAGLVLFDTGVTRETVLEGFTITGAQGTSNLVSALATNGTQPGNGGSPTIRNCVIRGNHGGPICMQFSFSRAALINCVIAGNDGWAVYDDISQPDFTIANCTIVGNGNGVYVHSGGAMIMNSIIRSNLGSQLLLTGNEPYSVSHCVVPAGTPGAGNINIDPMFVNAAGADGVIGTADDDFRLQAGSPCIDAGDSGVVLNLGLPGALDVGLKPRIANGPATDTGVGPGYVIDMGAYEFETPICAGDLDGDGVISGGDVQPFIVRLLTGGACP